MLTSYEKKQLKLVKKWQYEFPRIIMQCWDIVFLPIPDIFIPYLPYDPLEQVLEVSSLQPQFNVDKENLLQMNHVSLQDLKAKGLEFSDGLAEKVCKSFDFTQLNEKSSSVIMEFLLDIPDIVQFALRLIHQVGLCYGYELEEMTDKNYLLAILLTVSGDPQRDTSEICPSSLTNVHIRQLATQIGLEVTMRKFIVQNSYLSIFLGKSAAKWYFKEVGLAAQRIFQKRWLLDNDKWN